MNRGCEGGRHLGFIRVHACVVGDEWRVPAGWCGVVCFSGEDCRIVQCVSSVSLASATTSNFDVW